MVERKWSKEAQEFAEGRAGFVQSNGSCVQVLPYRCTCMGDVGSTKWKTSRKKVQTDIWARKDKQD